MNHHPVKTDRIIGVVVVSAISMAAFFAFTGTSQKDEARERSDKPNIIYILADDLEYGDLGSYGQEHIRTPHLDKMAEEGMRYIQHDSGSTARV